MKESLKTDMMAAFLALYPDMLGNEDRELVQSKYSDFVDDVMELGLQEITSRILFMKAHSKEGKE